MWKTLEVDSIEDRVMSLEVQLHITALMFGMLAQRVGISKEDLQMMQGEAIIAAGHADAVIGKWTPGGES